MQKNNNKRSSSRFFFKIGLCLLGISFLMSISADLMKDGTAAVGLFFIGIFLMLISAPFFLVSFIFKILNK